MTTRFVLIGVAGAAFVVTLMLLAGPAGPWKRSAEPPPAATQPAPQPVPAPQTVAKDDSPSNDIPVDTPAASAAQASVREPEQQQREATRGARTR